MSELPSEGYYPINTVNPYDARVEWRKAGGGVTRDRLYQSEAQACQQAIKQAKSVIATWEAKIREFEAAISRLQPTGGNDE